MFSRKPLNTALTICTLVLALGMLGTLPHIGSAKAPTGVTEEWTLQGRVYEGEVGDESTPLQGVNVAVYGANSSYPTPGTLIRDTNTGATGWFGITVYDDDLALYDYVYLLETDPAGYVSVNARSVAGTVQTPNWIEFAATLEGQDLSGNKFWDEPEIAGVLEGRVYEGEVGDESTPLQGVTVSAYGSNNAYPDAGELIASTMTNADGWYGLEVSEGYEFYHIRESDPDGYTSVDADSVAGTVQTPNWIEFTAPLESKDLTGNKFWDQPEAVEWSKLINGKPWDPELSTTVETSNTIEIKDVITTLPSKGLELVEEWNPAYLKLLDWAVTPQGSAVETDAGILTWQLPEGGQDFTLTKWFHVEPCTWRETTLQEQLSAGDQLLESRDVRIEKEPPQLWIESSYDVTVLPGDVATFTLSYGNKGGYENGVSIRNEFPDEAPFAWSQPPPDESTADGSEALWLLGDLAKGDEGDITVAVAIQETVVASETITIWDWIYDHVGEQRAEVKTEFHVGEAPEAEWWKYINGEPWDPQLTTTVETGDVIEVVDVVDSPGAFKLVEAWNPDHFTFQMAHITAGTIDADPGVLTWESPTEPTGAMTLTKQLVAKRGPWPRTIIEEMLEIDGAPESLSRLVPIEHLLPPIDFPGGDWPWYAQGEISVSPEPPVVGQPTHLCAEVISNDPANAHTVIVEFAVGNFGIGLPFTPVGLTTLTVPPGSSATGCVVWIPPTPNHWCVEVRLIHPGEDEAYRISQRNVDVDEPLKPDTPHTRTFSVGHPFPHPVTVTLELKNPDPAWGLVLSPETLTNVQKGEVRQAALTATPPNPLPPNGTVVVDVEASAMGQVFGGFRKELHPPVILHRFPDPPYAEREITVHPYPPMAGYPTEICVELYNPTDEPHDVEVQFKWANFGIGLPFTPINGLRPVHLPPHSTVNECIHWVPPTSGHICLEVELFMEGYQPQRSQLNVDIDEPLEPLRPHSRTFPVGNPFSHPMTVTLGLIPHAPGWGLELSPDTLPDMQPDEVRDVTLTVTPPEELPLANTAVVDVEAYADGQLIGGFRKSFRPPINLHPTPDPPYAEREITVHPDPPMANRPTEICVELRNPTANSHDVQVQFSWAAFGMGIPFTPINGLRPVHLPAHSVVEECIHWVPPTGGHICLQVELLHEDYETQRSQRNVDVAELLVPGEPDSIVFKVGNPLDEQVTVNLGVITYLPGWQIELSPAVLPDMEPDEVRDVTLTVTPPQGDLPNDGDVVVEVEAYANNRLIGGFRKTFRVPVVLHPLGDPPYAEREITVHPYPPMAGHPTEICVELYNPTDEPHDVEVQFKWANFGIGLSFTPINGLRLVHLPPHSTVNECIHWVPPTSGHVCLEVELFMEGYQPQRSQLNVDIDEPLEPLQPHSRTFPVGNPFSHPMTVTLGLIPHAPGWGLELSPDTLPDMQPDEVRDVTLTVTPPEELPPAGTAVVDVEAYADGQLIGGFRKSFHPPITLHPTPDPPYAEREITVHPDPPMANWPTEICVELRNPTAEPHDVDVQFSWAAFGMGIEFTPINGLRPVHLPPHSRVNECIHWVPPTGGHICLQVELFHEDYQTQRSQRNVDVAELLVPGEPDSIVFKVGNPLDEQVTVNLGIITYLPGWQIELSPDVLPDMDPDEVRDVTLTVTPPPGDLPDDGDVVVEVEAYANNRLIGGFRKTFRVPVPVHRPKDPIYAESEIFIDPYPVVPGAPTKLGVEVFNSTDRDQIVDATFSVAHFGIGLPFDPSHITPNPIQIFVPAHGAARGHTIWQPPSSWQGHACVRVTLEMEGHEPVWSQRNIDLGEPLRPGEPHALTFPVGVWPHTEPMTVTLGLVPHMPGWRLEVSPEILPNVMPGQPQMATLTVTPPDEAELGSGEPIVDVEAFVDGELIGGFRKLNIPPVPVHKPHEPMYAESEILIDPYPPQAEQPTQVSAVLQNASDASATVDVTFGWADFGAGIPFTTTGMSPIHRTLTLGPHATGTANVTWTPEKSGHHCLRVIVTDPAGVYEPQRSQRNVDVSERPPCGTPKTFTFAVYNDSPFPATLDIGLITFNVPPDWTVTTEPSGSVEIEPYGEVAIKVIVEIPCPVHLSAMEARQRLYALQQKAGSVPTVDVEAYIDGELEGGIEIQFPLMEPEQHVIYLPVVLKKTP